MDSVELVGQIILRAYGGVIPPPQFDAAFCGNLLLVLSPVIEELAIPEENEKFCQQVHDALQILRATRWRVM